MRIARTDLLQRTMVPLLFAIAIAATPGYAWALCTVLATPINFGSLPAIDRGGLTSVGSVAYTCTGPVPAGIKIVMGPGRSGTVGRRAMVGGHNRLPYILSLDPLGDVPWGDGSKGTQVYFNAHPPRNQTITIPVYGHILPGHSVPPNFIYRDSVAVVAFY
jgi:spore coat protein U-like protein